MHIPHLLYYWRSSPTSVASNISAKTYCLEAAVKALYAHYERVGVPVDEVSMIRVRRASIRRTIPSQSRAGSAS